MHRRSFSLLCLFLTAAAATAATARPRAQAVVDRMRMTWLHTETFSPASLRITPRLDPSAAIGEVREFVLAHPNDLEARGRLARLLDAADEREAGALWRAILQRLAPAGTLPVDRELLRIEAMLGVGAASAAAAGAEALIARQPTTWRAHLLSGDAHLRSADQPMRALLRLGTSATGRGADHLLALNNHLAAAERAYAEAVRLAPNDVEPRAGRMALLAARALLVGVLPAGLALTPLQHAAPTPVEELVEMRRRAAGAVAPTWQLARYLAATGVRAPAGVLEDLRKQPPNGPDPVGEAATLAAESAAFLATAARDWPRARDLWLRAAAMAPPSVRARNWLALCEFRAAAGRPEAALTAVEARLASAPSAEGELIRGVLLAELERPGALQALRRALDIDRANVNARYNLSVLLLRGDPGSSEARLHLAKVAEADLDDPEATFTLVGVRVIDGETDQTRRALAELASLTDVPDLAARARMTLHEISPPEAH